jgi:hypothetical protein
MRFRKLLEGRNPLYIKSYNELLTLFLNKGNKDYRKAYSIIKAYYNKIKFEKNVENESLKNVELVMKYLGSRVKENVDKVLTNDSEQRNKFSKFIIIDKEIKRLRQFDDIVLLRNELIEKYGPNLENIYEFITKIEKQEIFRFDDQFGKRINLIGNFLFDKINKEEENNLEDSLSKDIIFYDSKDDKKILNILKNDDIISTIPLNSGVNKTILTSDGVKGVFKPQSGESPILVTNEYPEGTLYKREVAAFKVDRILGFGL